VEEEEAVITQHNQLNHDIQSLIEAHLSDVCGGELSPRQADAMERGRIQTLTVDMAVGGQLMVMQMAADDDGGLVVAGVDFLQNAGGGS